MPCPPLPHHLSTTLQWLKTHCTTISTCKQAHAILLRRDLLHHPHLSSKLLSFLSPAGPTPAPHLSYARTLFSALPRRDLFIFNALIRAHARGPTPSSALPFLSLMAHSSLPPDHHTFPFALTACSRSRDPAHGTALHASALKLGLAADTYVLNSLIQMYAACGHPNHARQLFDASPNRDVVTWNTMIKCYVDAGFLPQAFRWFDEMVTTAEPDSVTVITLVSACSQMRDLDKGKWLHEYAKERGLLLARGSLNLRNAVLDMYCKCKDLASAREVFNSVPEERDVFTWTVMVSGLADCGCFRESLELFQQMQREGIRPDPVIVVAVLSVCAHLGALDQGKYVHLLVERFRIKRDVVLETALVDMYAKCGNLELAMQVFESMKERNVFTWNAMIGGIAIHGHGGYALEVFTRMKHERTMVPDDVTFIGLLSACRHSGLVDEGLELFKEMKQAYRIEPRMEHYGCVVDLFCRAKLARDALAFIENMPIRPNVVVLASLVSACRVLEDSELAERIGKIVVELEPDSCDRYVMLSNLYAGVGRWDDASKVRNIMEAKGINKTPGISWIELDGIVHQFVAGDRSHDQAARIYMMVEEMCLRVKSAGHITGTKEVLFNIEEEEKEHSLFLHSEKLAVAFGLLSTAAGSPIRITKNLRVCTDCHSFLKIVSKVFGREIIARDRSRFHHFREGMCSCTDFW